MNRNEKPPVSALEVAGFVWSHWRRYPLMLASLMLTMLGAAGFDVLFPVVSAHLVDTVAKAGDNPDRAAVEMAAIAVLFLIGQGLGFNVMRAVAFRIWMRFATRCMHAIVTEAFARVQSFSSDWHANNFGGATVRKITRGMWAYDTFADTVYIGIFPTVAVLTGVTGLLFWQWPLMGAAVTAVTAVYVAVTLYLAKYYAAPANRAHNKADSEVGAALADAVTCNSVVKSFGAEARESLRLSSVVDLWKARALTAWLRMENLNIVQVVLLNLMKLALFGLVIWFWMKGEADVGGVTFVMTSYMLISSYLRDIGMHLQNLQQAINELDDVVAFSKLPPGVTDRPDAFKLEARAGAIAFEEVTFRYRGQTVPIYDRFSLRIRPGEKIALVGPSGSGKSTFVKLLQRLYDIEEGRILIDGQNAAFASQASLREAIALVPQEPILFHRSLADNIAYARPGATRKEVEAAAQRARAHGFITRLPQGYDTLVGERGVKLSGGERQRVALARAFLADAPILVLDEATSSLDSITEAEVQEAIEELMAGRTTIIIAHRLSTVRAVDRILVFKDGAVVEEGAYDDLRRRKGSLFHQLHEHQMKGLSLTGG